MNACAGKPEEEVYQIKGKDLYQLNFVKLMGQLSPDSVPTLNLFTRVLIHWLNACHGSGTGPGTVGHR